jgi:DNA mismatch repair ATPase MutL
MFYNMMARRRAFKPGPEEHNLLMDVLQRYAIHKAGSVGFTLKRQVCVGSGLRAVCRAALQFAHSRSLTPPCTPQGEARSDLHTLPTASRLDVIRSLFGTDLAASLLPLAVTGGSGDVSADVP